MRNLFLLIFISVLLLSCGTKPGDSITSPVAGTWKLVSGTLIEKGDTVVTDYSRGVSFIKIINESHFAFLHHDLNQGRDSSAVFTAGGGRYVLADSVYTEHLEYCTDRAWEGHDFSFVVRVSNDTLVQRGVEILEEAGINRVNIEVYVRVKKEDNSGSGL